MTLIPDLAARLVKQGGVLEPINSIVRRSAFTSSASHKLHPQGRQPLRISIVEGRLRPALQQGAVRKAGIKGAGRRRPRNGCRKDGQADAPSPTSSASTPQTPWPSSSRSGSLLQMGQRLRREVGDRQKPNLTDPKIIKTLTI